MLFGSFCRDEDRNNQSVMALFMEAFEVQRVVCHLLQGIARVGIAPALELKQKNNTFIDKDIIDAVADTGDGILKQQITIAEVCQLAL